MSKKNEPEIDRHMDETQIEVSHGDMQRISREIDAINPGGVLCNITCWTSSVHGKVLRANLVFPSETGTPIVSKVAGWQKGDIWKLKITVVG